MTIKDKVFEIVAKIPKGKVMTYGQIARIADSGPRAVGQFLHKNIDPNKYPCHRVVFSDGSMAASYAFGGEGKQRELLLAEGIEFTNGKVKRNFIGK